MLETAYFPRRGGVLHAATMPLPQLAGRYGTPSYVYAAACVTAQLARLRAGLGSLPHLICYAVKANGNLALLQHLAAAGIGFDAVSGGELQRVLRAGGVPQQTILSGVGKSDDEIAQAVAAGVLYIAVESAAELRACAELGIAQGRPVPVSLRVNPDVDAQTHPYIATGLKESKFGVPMADAAGLLALAAAHPGLELRGITCHIGSQITSLGPFEAAAARLVALARALRQDGIAIHHIGLGGGLGIAYQATDRPPTPEAYGQALAAALAPLGLPLILEPGRVLVAAAGLLLTRVVRLKAGDERNFVLLDAGMNDLLRPALYGAHHDILPVVAHAGAICQPYDVVGPVCESADVFAHARPLPPLQAGDLLAIADVGAYGAAMASTYNGRPRAAELWIDGDHCTEIRVREPVAALWRDERGLDGRRFGP